MACWVLVWWVGLRWCGHGFCGLQMGVAMGGSQVVWLWVLWVVDGCGRGFQVGLR